MRTPVRVSKGKIAAILIDLQEEHRKDSRYLVEDFGIVLSRCASLQVAARQNGVPVFNVAYVIETETAKLPPFFPRTQDGTPAFSVKEGGLAGICPEVAPREGDILIEKTAASAFSTGQLSARLKSMGVEWIVVAGVWTEACVDATVKDAIAVGFHIILVKDACGSATRAMHQVAILNLANRLYGGAVASTVDACRILSGDEARLWMVEGSVPLRFTHENAENIYRGL